MINTNETFHLNNHMTKEEKKCLYDEIMYSVYDTVISIINESEEQKTEMKKGFEKNFLDNKDVIALIYSQEMPPSKGYAFIYQKIDDNEYDVYHFIINLKNGKISKAGTKNKNTDEKELVSKTEKYLKSTAKIESVKVRSVYTDIDDIKSIFEVISEDPYAVIKGFCKILGVSTQLENPAEKKEKSKNNNKNTKHVTRDKEGKLTGEWAEYAKNITNILKETSKSDDAFIETVRLFRAIEQLA
jgi:hypothetical protein